MRSPPIWRLVPGQRLVHRCHDGECVLFNDLTGDTHLLGQDVLDLLGLLRGASQPAALLATLLAGADADAGTLDELDEVLADLAALNLVEAQPC
ncbi:HPr-rel-A system PqqD family peptide chaperone [Massilia sp. YIM B02769]|uniref:HPr-rel-A system PqqD family peptide chaperone n=1 Tax=unclassified Massilia TaxID=2609279 RepID=UPI0025B63782|nr:MULTISPECIES: HPr-rel-A system PqqD family peptide chaperone [unclassified Massilia]MDN4057014.1 HPr-rel-A system PqqD family peptide chaperone [Massilia sp. YIM B02769]